MLLSLYYILLGIINVLFGILKTFICAVNLLTTKDNIDFYNKYVGFIINNDLTDVTKIFFLVLLIFSIFSFLKGLIYLKVKKNFIPNDLKYIIYLLFGFFLIFFNILVIYYPQYTAKYISRDNKHLDTYLKVYVGTGILFIITLIFTYIFYEYKKMPLILLILLLLLFIVLIFTMMYVGSFNYFEEKTREEIITFIMIPLGIM